MMISENELQQSLKARGTTDNIPLTDMQATSFAFDSGKMIQNSNASDNAIKDLFSTRNNELISNDPDNRNRYEAYNKTSDRTIQQVQDMLENGDVIFNGDDPILSWEKDYNEYTGSSSHDEAYDDHIKEAIKNYVFINNQSGKYGLDTDIDLKQKAISKTKQISYEQNIRSEQNPISSFIGGMGAGFVDPVNIAITLATLPIAPVRGATIAGTVAKTIGQESLFAIPAEGIIQSENYAWRKQIQEDWNIKQAFYEGAIGVAATGVFAGSIRLGTHGISGLYTKIKDNKDKTVLNKAQEGQDLELDDIVPSQKESINKLPEEQQYDAIKYDNAMSGKIADMSEEQHIKQQQKAFHKYEEGMYEPEINPRQEFINNIRKQIEDFDPYTRENISLHPKLDTLLNFRKDVLSKDIRYPQKLANKGALNNDGEYFSPNYEKNFLADFELTKKDVENIRKGKISDETLVKLQNDLGRIDNDPQYLGMGETIPRFEEVIDEKGQAKVILKDEVDAMEEFRAIDRDIEAVKKSMTDCMVG